MGISLNSNNEVPARRLLLELKRVLSDAASTMAPHALRDVLKVDWLPLLLEREQNPSIEMLERYLLAKQATVRVKRGRSLEKALAGTRRRVSDSPYGDKTRGFEYLSEAKGTVSRLTFFRFVDEAVFGDEIVNEYARRRLKPADPWALTAAINRYPRLGREPEFVTTVWKGGGRWYQLAFGSFEVDHDRYVQVGEESTEEYWIGSAWYAGVRA